MSFIVKKMNWKPLQLSLIFHGIILFALINFNISSSRPQKILVIDFTIGNEPYMPQQGTHATTVTVPAITAKHPVGVRLTKPVPNQQKDVLQPTVTLESSDTQNQPQTTVTTISQPDLDTQIGLPEFHRFGAQNLIHEAGVQKGVPSVISDRGNGDIGSSEKSRYLKAHFSYIKDLIHKHLIYPALAKKMGWEGKVIVSFIISSGGNAKDITLSKSSGYEILDDNALRAVRMATPFPKPPVEAQIIVPVLYRLNY